MSLFLAQFRQGKAVEHVPQCIVGFLSDVPGDTERRPRTRRIIPEAVHQADLPIDRLHHLKGGQGLGGLPEEVPALAAASTADDASRPQRDEYLVHVSSREILLLGKFASQDWFIVLGPGKLDDNPQTITDPSRKLHVEISNLHIFQIAEADFISPIR